MGQIFFWLCFLVAGFILLRKHASSGYFGIVTKVLASLFAVAIFILVVYVILYFGFDLYYNLFGE